MNKKEKSFAKKIIPLIIIAIIIYTSVCLYLAYLDKQVSDALTVAYFSFWGTELISLATIKNNKTKSLYGVSDSLENTYNKNNNKQKDDDTIYIEDITDEKEE